MDGLDALIIAALPMEYEAARQAALASPDDDQGIDGWRSCEGDPRLPYLVGTYLTAGGDRLTVALARPTRQGPNSAASLAASLVERLRPRCLAMCGVCAGHPGDVALGDVIVASLAYAHDEGRRTPDGFVPDQRQIPMSDIWVRKSQDLALATPAVPSYGRASRTDLRFWLLDQLDAGRDPWNHPARPRYFPTKRAWQSCLESAQQSGLLVQVGDQITITGAGRAFVAHTVRDNLDRPDKLPFGIVVGPMASGSFVVGDGVTWDQLRKGGVRTTVGVDMEAATIASVAHGSRVPDWVVIKGVMDHADHRKNDRYKSFAARVSAEVLFRFLASRLARPAAPVAPTPTISSTHESITVLHLPGMRFDTRRPVADAERRAVETLGELGALHKDHGIRPDLVVVSGDLTEAAKPAEYDRAYAFLSNLRDGLGLHPRRLVVVPGRHDVNRKLCQAYFLAREVADEEAAPPYWPKWEPYAALFTRLYAAEFPRDEPWTLIELPELKTVVAGLNSTMADSHLNTGNQHTDRPGSLGDKQLHWFAERLAHARARGWLRLGVLHHAPGDNTDAAAFVDLLGEQFNVVFSSGDGPLGRIVRIRPDELKVWTRPDWRAQATPIQLSDVSAVFPTVRDQPAGSVAKPVLPARHRVDLLSRIAEICRLRLPQANVREVRTIDQAPPYLHVAIVREYPNGRSMPVEQYPIGACEGTATRDDVERFINTVDALYRNGGSVVSSTLVYGGAPAAAETRDHALRRGVELLSFAEYQLGYDLRPYARRQAERLASDGAYPAEMYIPQRYVEIEGHGSAPKVTGVREDLLEQLRGWLADPDGHLIIVLGAFGHGKTFLLRQLARQMHADGDPVVPVLVHLRDLEKAHDLDQLVAAQLAAGGERRIDLTIFRYLLREGRIALLFDGFDELAVRVTYEAVAGHLDRILHAAEGRAKVVIASRDQHFLTDAEVLSALGDRLATVAGRRLVKLAHFNDDQIAAFVRTRMGDRAAEHWLELLRDIQDLLGLSRNPRMLEFITRIDEEKLRAARQRTGEFTAAVLYQKLLDEWQEFEYKHHERPGGAPPPTRDQFWHAVTQLALRLWGGSEPALGRAELGVAADALLALSVPDVQAGVARPDREETTHVIGSQTLLVRDGEGRFTFVHQSVMEFLVARHAAEQLVAKQPTPDALRREMSELMADFLCDLAGRGVALDWARSILANAEASDAAGENALLILRRLGVEAKVPARLAERKLPGADLSGQALHNADLRRADLTEANLSDADLTGANLTGACLVRARLDRSYLCNAILTDADLSSASLLGADLTGADLTGARLWRTALVGAHVSVDALAGAATTWGAALPANGPPRLQLRTAATPIRVIAFGPRPDVLASGSADGTVRIWDPVSGVVVREFAAYASPVVAVRFSPDGRWLAAAGDSTVQIWDVESGTLVRELTSPADSVLSVAFSPDGRWLAAAVDTAVKIWDPTTGVLVCELTGPAGGVLSVAYSPDGQRLAVAGVDRTVRLWDPVAGVVSRELVGPNGRVLSMAFSPDGRLLAGGCSDFRVWLWDPTTGSAVRQLSGHTDWVFSVSFSPDGRLLASAGDDAKVRIWNADTGTVVRELGGRPGVDVSAVFSPDGRWLASAGHDRVIRLWNTDSGALARTLAGQTEWLLSVRFSPDGRWLLEAGDDAVVRIWDTHTGWLARELSGHAETVWIAKYSPDGRWVASAGQDRVVRIWNAGTGALVHQLGGHLDAVWSVTFSPDGRALASAGADSVIRIWDPATGTLTRTLNGHSDGVCSVAFSPGGSLLASAGVDHVIRLWDPATGELLRWYDKHTDVVHSIRFSPDGRLLASGGTDRVIRLWSLDSIGTVRELAAHSGSVRAVEFSPDGRWLVTAGLDRGIKVWNVAGGRLVRELTEHNHATWAVAFSPDGQWLASAGDDRAVRLWDFASGTRRAELLPLSNGCAVFGDDLGYQLVGSPGGNFWYTVGLCRFEPGELDAHVPQLRMVADTPLLDS